MIFSGFCSLVWKPPGFAWCPSHDKHSSLLIPGESGSFGCEEFEFPYISSFSVSLFLCSHFYWCSSCIDLVTHLALSLLSLCLLLWPLIISLLLYDSLLVSALITTFTCLHFHQLLLCLNVDISPLQITNFLFSLPIFVCLSLLFSSGS